MLYMLSSYVEAAYHKIKIRYYSSLNFNWDQSIMSRSYNFWCSRAGWEKSRDPTSRLFMLYFEGRWHWEKLLSLSSFVQGCIWFEILEEGWEGTSFPQGKEGHWCSEPNHLRGKKEAIAVIGARRTFSNKTGCACLPPGIFDLCWKCSQACFELDWPIPAHWKPESLIVQVEL